MKNTGYRFYFRKFTLKKILLQLIIFVFITLTVQSCYLLFPSEYNDNVKTDNGFIILSVDKDGKESVFELFNVSMNDDFFSYELQLYNDNELILVQRNTYRTGYIISIKANQFNLSDAKQFSIQGDKISHFREQSGKWIFEEINSTIQFPNSSISISSNEKSDIYKLSFQNGDLQANKTFTLNSQFINDSVLVTYKFKENCFLDENAFYFTEQTHKISNIRTNSGFSSTQTFERELVVLFDTKDPQNPILIPYNELVSGNIKLHFVSKEYIILEESNSSTLFKAKRIDDGYIITTIGIKNRFLGVFDGILINNYTLFNIYANTETPISLNYFFYDVFYSKGYNLGKFIIFASYNSYYSTRIGKINKETFEISDKHHFTIEKQLDIQLYNDIIEPVSLTNGTSYLLIGESHRPFLVNY